MKHFFDNTKEMVLGTGPIPCSSGTTRDHDHLVPRAEAPVPRALPRHSPAHAARRREPALRRVPLLLHGVPGAVHLHRAGRVRAGRQAARLRAVPGEVRHRRAPLHLLRLLRRGVPLRRDPDGYGRHAAPYDSRDQFIYGKDLLLNFPGRDGSTRRPTPVTSRAIRGTRASTASTLTERFLRGQQKRGPDPYTGLWGGSETAGGLAGRGVGREKTSPPGGGVM